MQNYSYHTHTTFSDGKDSLEDMLEHAVAIGYTEIGITDHLIIHRNIKSLYNWSELKDPDYNVLFFDNYEKAKQVLTKNVSYIRKTAEKYPIKISIGFEVDFFDDENWLEDLKSLMKDIDADYLLFGSHYFSYEGKVLAPDFLAEYEKEGLSPELLMKKYLNGMVKGIKSEMFDFVAHLDYARKYVKNFDDFKPEIMKIIEALAETKTAYEISTKGLRRIGDFFPTRWIVEELKKRDVPIIISDDAHKTAELGYEFYKAENLLKELNYTNRWKPGGKAKFKHCI